MYDEHSMKELIDSFLSRNDKSKLYHERLAVDLWKNETGSFIAQNTGKVQIRNGVLYIQILNASLKFELLGRKSALIEDLNKKIGEDVVKDIIFT